MNRQELEHIVRAAAGITGETEFIVIGSQSILGNFPMPRVLSVNRWKPTSTRRVPRCLGTASRKKERGGLS